jgi:hypothetical protein
LTETQQLQLWSRRYTAGAGWLEPVAMATTPGLTLPDFDLALSADGSGVAVWLEASLDDSDHAVWGSHFDATLGWDEAVKLEGGAERPSSLSVGIDASGNAIAAWEALTQMQTGYYNRILVSHYLTDEGWTGTTQLAEDAGYVTLAVSAEGSAVAAWREPYAVDGSSDGEIVAANFLPWLGWADPLVFSAKPAGDAYRSALAINDYGQATLLWEQTAEPGQGDILASQLR